MYMAVWNVTYVVKETKGLENMATCMQDKHQHIKKGFIGILFTWKSTKEELEY